MTQTEFSRTPSFETISLPDVPLSEVEKPRVIIAVMGQTGTGKTTFVNTASGSNLTTAGGLASCTSNVQASEPFELDGRSVTLLDTPGFDDSERSDVDVLHLISEFLAETYMRGEQLAGIIYTHRISDNRMGSTSQQNFRMFRKLCGQKAAENVIIVTTMWDKGWEEGESREKDLQNVYFKPALDDGAQMCRCERRGDINLSHEILRRIIRNHPLPLQIQQELVDEQKPLSETAAGKELNRQLEAQKEKYEKRVRYLEEEKQEAIKAKDEEAKQEIERALKKQGEKIRNLESEIKKLWASVAVGVAATGAAIVFAVPIIAANASGAAATLGVAGLVKALTRKIVM